jgi:uncharacterized membrane protein required for colicin V production
MNFRKIVIVQLSITDQVISFHFQFLEKTLILHHIRMALKNLESFLLDFFALQQK